MEGTQEDTKFAGAPPGQRQTRQNGPAIAEFRRLRDKSQSAVAREAGIGQPALSLIESETVSARITTLTLIAQSLGVSVDAILRNCPQRVPSVFAEGKAA